MLRNCCAHAFDGFQVYTDGDDVGSRRNLRERPPAPAPTELRGKKNPHHRANAADVVAVFNCGGTGDRAAWMDTTKGWTSATLGTNGGSFNVTASGSGITLSSTTGAGVFSSTGPGGSFKADPDASEEAVSIPTDLKTLSTSVLGDDYGTLWGGSINVYGTGQTTFTSGGLEANTQYTVYLFCARANANNNGSATWSTTTSGASWSVWTIGDSGSAEKKSGSMVSADGSSNGDNASIVEVTFNTGSDTSFTFDSGENATFTLNGIVVDQGSSIPEPSAFGLLAGLGALALVASRRRRK